MEVTLLDHRFLRCKPSLIAAIGMYAARRMLDGEWVSVANRQKGTCLTLPQNDAFVFYSNYTETQLLPGARILIEQMAAPDFEKQYVYKKYTNKKFLRASTFARDWAKQNVVKDGMSHATSSAVMYSPSLSLRLGQFLIATASTCLDASSRIHPP